MNKFFKLEERGTTVSKEFIAGLTTFLSMAYIIFVNPNTLGAAGMDTGAVFTATISTGNGNECFFRVYCSSYDGI